MGIQIKGEKQLHFQRTASSPRFFFMITAFSAVLLIACGQTEPTPALSSVTLSADRDGTLYETVDGALSNGAGQHLFAGKTNTEALRRGLVRFAIDEEVPAGATITGARLVLQLSRSAGAAQEVTLHLVMADWGEGSSDAELQEGQGAPAMPEDATWVHRFFDTELWATPGGDFDATASATASIGELPDPFTWTSDRLAEDVQGWLDDPTTNFGWLLMGNEEERQTTKRFRSRENPVEDGHPTLIVEFVP